MVRPRGCTAGHQTSFQTRLVLNCGPLLIEADMDKFLSDLVEDVRDNGEETAAAGDQESPRPRRSQHNKQCYTNGMNHTGYLLEIGLKGIPLFLIQTLKDT